MRRPVHLLLVDGVGVWCNPRCDPLVLGRDTVQITTRFPMQEGVKDVTVVCLGECTVQIVCGWGRACCGVDHVFVWLLNG